MHKSYVFSTTETVITIILRQPNYSVSAQHFRARCQALMQRAHSSSPRHRHADQINRPRISRTASSPTPGEATQVSPRSSHRLPPAQLCGENASEPPPVLVIHDLEWFGEREYDGRSSLERGIDIQFMKMFISSSCITATRPLDTACPEPVNLQLFSRTAHCPS